MPFFSNDNDTLAFGKHLLAGTYHVSLAIKCRVLTPRGLC